MKQRKLRIVFRDPNHRPALADLDENYKLELSADGLWLKTPNGIFNANEILTAQIVTEEQVIRAA